jgi:hypothetical protein
MNEFAGVSMEGFQPIKRTLILGNGGPFPMYPTYASNGYDVPARNVLGPKPGLTVDGRPIPGTRLVEAAVRVNDAHEVVDDLVQPGEIYEIPADEILKGILGFAPKTATATSDFARRGLTWIPNGSTMEKAEEILAAAAERWAEADLDDARKMLEVQQVKLEAAKAAGLHAPAVPKGFHKIEAKVKAADAQIYAQYQAPTQAGQEMDELEFEFYAKNKLLDMINEDPKLSELSLDAKMKRADDLLADPKIKMHLRKQGYIVKKVGAPTAAELRKMRREAEVEDSTPEPVGVPMDLENAS